MRRVFNNINFTARSRHSVDSQSRFSDFICVQKRLTPDDDLQYYKMTPKRYTDVTIIFVHAVNGAEKKHVVGMKTYLYRLKAALCELVGN